MIYWTYLPIAPICTKIKTSKPVYYPIKILYHYYITLWLFNVMTNIANWKKPWPVGKPWCQSHGDLHTISMDLPRSPVTTGHRSPAPSERAPWAMRTSGPRSRVRHPSAPCVGSWRRARSPGETPGKPGVDGGCFMVDG